MKDFTKGNVPKQIFLFALPMLVGNLFQQVYSMVDAMIVGRMVGGTALAAVGTSMTVIQFLLSVLFGLTTGASVVISQFYGAKREEDLRRTVSTSVIFLVGVGLAVAVGGYITAPWMLRALGVEDVIFADALAYLRVIMVGMLFAMLYNIYTAYLRALGDSKRPLYILILSTILNTVLDYVFVGPLNMGVAGAAWATIIAQAVASVVCYLYAAKTAPLLRIKRLVFDTALLRIVLRYSIPAALQLSLTSLAHLTIMRLVNGFGAVSVAGYTAALKIDQFAIIPLNSVSMATSTFVGQNMGAGLEGRAKKGLHASLGLMVGLGLLLSLVGFVAGKPLISLFVDPLDADYASILAVGSRYLSIIVAFYVLFGVFFAFNGFFRGVGDAVTVMVLTTISLTIRAVCAYWFVGSFEMGPEAVAWSIPIGWALCSLYAWFHYKKRFWAGKAATAAKPKAT